nr:molybdopterin-dependent oxidoreductase [Planctomycetota bacterium]
MSDPARGGTTTRTTCCYCGVGCGIRVRSGRDGTLTLDGDPDHPTNRGALCSKGRTLLHVVASRAERLQWPQLRRARQDPLRRCGWDEAIAHIASEFKRIQATHGRDSVALYVSGQCLTEEYYLANKIAKGFLATNNIDTNSRLCMSSAVAGYKQTLGADAPPISYDDIEVCDTFLIAGANPAWCHPILFRRIEARKAADAQRVRLICIDPRRTATAAVSDLHLAIRPGTDVALFHALARELRERGGLDRAYIAAHTEGWDALDAAIEPWTLERAAEHCGLAAADIATAASWLVGDRRFLSLWTMGLNQSAVGVDKNVALINLSLITGKIGKPGCGPFSLTGQPNAMGGREVGGLANLLPAHRDLANPEHRAEVARYWGIDPGTISAAPGLTAVEMFQAARDGRLKALWVICTNPAASLPDGGKVEEALRALELLVVQDIFPTDTTAFADVVLPAATWLEKTGTMTSSERRITLLDRVVDAPGEALSDVEILLRFARAMGWERSFPYADEAAVYREHAELTRGMDCDISALDHARLRQLGGAQWPVTASAPAGTPRLYVDGCFPTPSGRARLRAPAVVDRSETLDGDFPLVLDTGRVRDQWHTMTKTGRVAKLLATADAPFCEIHPDDAAARGIAGDDIVEVHGRRGVVQVRAEVTTAIRPGVVFLPMHWGRRLGGERGRANALTSPTLDPVSKEPDLKYAAVQVRRHAPTRRRICIVGAGAAALGFIDAHHRWAKDDEIHVFGEEPEAIYNRVLLPHYIDGSLGWERLVRHDRATLAERGVIFHGGTRIAAIDRERRTISDVAGGVHGYDLLILATGSRPNLPASGPLARQGVLGLRTRGDAERIRAMAVHGCRAVIQGAGLLGIELAGALAALGCAVTIIQRSGRLMGKQLDAKASLLLHSHLEDRGIAVRYDANLLSVTGDPAVTGVRLDDGEVLPCDLFIIATGTTPNAGLARAAGLACGAGITVDQHLTTSDPAIRAIGECAELAGKSYGTTASAEEQAQALAEHLRGNLHAPYRGSVVANILKLADVPLAACGLVDSDGDPTLETVVLEDPRRRLYQKAVIRDDRLVGVIMLGSIVGFAEHRELIARGTELEQLRDRLLRLGGAGGGGPRGKLI